MDCVWLADVAVSSPSVAGAECSGICLLLCLCYCQTSLLLFAVIPESCSRESVVINKPCPVWYNNGSPTKTLGDDTLSNCHPGRGPGIQSVY